MKVAIGTFGAGFVVWSRMAVAVAVLLPAAPRILARAAYAPGDWKWLGLMALLQPCLYFLLEANALRYTTSSQAGMIAALLPLMVCAGAGALLGERVAGRTWAGCAVSALGVAWLTWLSAPSQAAANPVLGNTLEVAAMASSAGFMLLVSRLAARYDADFLTLVQFGAGALFFLPGALDPAPWRALASPWAAAALLYLGFFVTLGAFGLWNWASRRVPASQSSALVNLMPVIAVGLGLGFLDERLSALQGVACAVVVAGVLRGQWRPRPRAGGPEKPAPQGVSSSVRP
jgi:drug/metabolite transporter (DMT)-like permease